MIEVVIDSIRVSLISQQRIVMLREENGEQQLPIWIGPCEADAISIKLQETEIARPMTHDLVQIVIDRLGGSISHIVIDDLRDEVFHAKMYVDVNGKTEEVDCRSSDAIAIAVRVDAPIYVADSVMEEAGILPESDITADEEDLLDELVGEETASEEGESEIDIGAFKDFLTNLDDDEADSSGGS